MTYEQLQRQYRVPIRALANKLTTLGPDVVDDLVQIGHITLWQLPLGRIRSNPDAYIRQALKYRMLDHLRWLHRDRLVSLDACLSEGYDVVLDQHTKEPRLIHGSDDHRHGGVAWADATVDWGLS